MALVVLCYLHHQPAALGGGSAILVSKCQGVVNQEIVLSRSFRITEDPATALQLSVLPRSFSPPLNRGRKAQDSMERVTVP